MFFWRKCLKNALWSQFCGSAEFSMKEHLTSKEVEKMTDIENNPTEHREYIIENDYTGFISPSNINDIIGTVLVSIVTKR